MGYNLECVLPQVHVYELRHILRLTDFIDRLVPSKKPADGAFLKTVLKGLKRLADAQNANPWLTISVTVTGGIWVFYRSKRRWLINPAQNYLRVETAFGQTEEYPDIGPALQAGIESGDTIQTDKAEFRQWQVSASALDHLWTFLENLEKPAEDLASTTDPSHPRYFPGDVRQAALEQFERDGRMCRGVASHAKSHKVEQGGLIEFDHVLPHSKGGTSSYWNVQVLCMACNRLKRATAA